MYIILYGELRYNMVGLDDQPQFLLWWIRQLTSTTHYTYSLFFFLKIAEISGGAPVKKPKKIAKPAETSSDSDGGMKVIQYDDSSDSLEVDAEIRKLEQGLYVIVKYCSKRHVAHFVGQVTHMTDERLLVNFLKQSGDTFLWPEEADENIISVENIECALPSPKKVGGTAQACLKLVFPEDDVQLVK